MVEEFGLGWEFALETEVVGRGDDAASEVMVPNAVDDDAGEEVACAVFRIGDPVGEAATSVAGAGPVGGWGFVPVAGGLIIAHEDLKVAGLRDALLLAGVTAAQKVGFRIEVGEAAAIGVVFGWGESFTGDLNFGDGGLGFGGEGFLDGVGEFLPLRVGFCEEGEEGLALLFGEVPRAESF